MSDLRVQLFDNLQLVYNNEVVAVVNSGRQQSLLAYLVLHCHAAQPRHQIAFRLWPDHTEAHAHANLRKTLYRLRRDWPLVNHLLAIDSQTLLWRSTSPVTIDVTEFEAKLTEADAAELAGQDDRALALLEAAVALYSGDLLLTCYDDWIVAERERLAQRYVEAVTRLIMACEARQHYPQAIRYAQELLRRDPLNEKPYCHLIRLYSLSDRPVDELRTYNEYVIALQNDLGLDAQTAHQEAYARLHVQNVDLTLPLTAPTPKPAGRTLVGRDAELRSLSTAWDTASKGESQFVLVKGEAGIGKSRLVDELIAWAQPQRINAVRSHCYVNGYRLAYGPVIEWLRADAFHSNLAVLEDVWFREVARLLPELRNARAQVLNRTPLTGSWQRARLFEALARCVLTRDRPLLLVIDDLQWCDEETVEWISYLLNFATQAQLLIVGTVRSGEFSPMRRDGREQLTALSLLLAGLQSSDQLTEIELNALDGRATATLAAQVAGHALDAKVAEELYRETEGNPLFVVETARLMVGHSLRGPSSNRALLPRKVRTMIESRLNELSPLVREVACLAATIGKSFTFNLLAAASRYDEETVLGVLEELGQRRIIIEQRAEHYAFSHDKLRAVAYAAMSKTRQRLFQRSVDDALKSVQSVDLDDQAVRMAGRDELGASTALAISR